MPTPESNNANRGLSLTVNDVAWTGERVDIDYEITNLANGELVLFENLFNSERLYAGLFDGVLRLFKGKPSFTADSDTPTEGAGIVISAQQTLSGKGFSEFPVLTNFGESIELADAEDIEFCIAYATADVALPTQNPNGTFPDQTGFDLQQFACQPIEKP